MLVATLHQHGATDSGLFEKNHLNSTISLSPGAVFSPKIINPPCFIWFLCTMLRHCSPLIKLDLQLSIEGRSGSCKRPLQRSHGS